MAATRRHWKEKDGRFWARIAVPNALIQILGKSELMGPLGGDRRKADRNHPAAVARLQALISEAQLSREQVAVTLPTSAPSRDLTADDLNLAAWAHQALLRN